MSQKQTSCPNCLTKYKVSVEQLTIAQGMVCCAKCSTNFNALIHIVVEKDQLSSTTLTSLSTDPQKQTSSITNNKLNSTDTPEHEYALLNIFYHKVENSNIDLKTYLNNLNYFRSEVIGHYPIMNWDEMLEKTQKRGTCYYIFWAAINICLICLLIFQFFWFNPKFLNNSPAFSAVLNQLCKPLNCSILNQNYQLLATNKVKVRGLSDHGILFTGELINYHSKSLPLPILKLDFKKNGQVISSYSLNPSEYLINSLHGIQRIPQNSPFKFKFKLPVPRESFDTYNLEIISP